MRLISHLLTRRRITLGFQGSLRGAEQQRFFRHLETCMECHALFSAQLWAEEAEPGFEDRRHRRMERSLFGAAEERPSGRLLTGRRLAFAGAVCAVVLALLVLRPDKPFRVKAAGEDDYSRHVSIAVYQRTAGGELTPVERTISGRAALAFAYTNTSHFRPDHLLLFGVDEHFNVYWYYPAWTDPGKNPTAHPILRGTGIELDEQVRHRYQGRWLRVFALFTRRGDLTVKEIERVTEAMSRSGQRVQDLTRFPMAQTGQHTLLLRVRPP